MKPSNPAKKSSRLLDSIKIERNLWVSSHNRIPLALKVNKSVDADQSRPILIDMMIESLEFLESPTYVSKQGTTGLLSSSSLVWELHGCNFFPSNRPLRAAHYMISISGAYFVLLEIMR